MENLMFDLKLTTISPVSLNKRLIESCDQLFRVYQQLSSVAPSLDFPGVHANGIRSLCSIIDKFASMIRQNLDKETIPFEQIIDVIELFGGMGEVVLKQRRIEIETKNDSNQLVDDSVFLRDVTVWWNFCKSNQSRLTTYFEKFTLFFIEPEIRLFISLIGKSFGFLSSTPALFGSLVSSSVNGAALSSLTYKGSLYYPLRTWSLFDNPVVNSVASWQASKYSVQATTVFIPRQDKWFIPSDGSPTQSKSIFSTSDDRSTFLDKKIRCRLLQSKIHQPNGKLVLHIAGGGFVMFKPEASEGAYLQYWVSHLDGTTFLSVDYTKLVTYPIAFQEVLDVYLWAIGLSNADQCTPESVLGFKPSKVVLCGDSAGSHLAFSILRSLHDIQANSPQGPRIPFPTGFVSFYTNMSVDKIQTSLSLSCFELALTPSVLLSIYGLLASGFVLDEDIHEIDDQTSVDQSHYSQPDFKRDNIRTWFRHGSNWFDCDPKELSKRLQKISKNTSKAYLKPLTSHDIDLLAEIPLYLVIGEYDFFLDGSVNLAKAWKGSVTLDVVKNLGHGFLSYSKISAQARKGCDIGLKRLRQALELPEN